MNTSNCNHVWCTHRNILDQMQTVDNLKFYIYHPNFPHKCDQDHWDSSLGNQTQDHKNCPHHQPNYTEFKAPPSDITDSTPVEIYTTTDGDQYFLKNFDSKSSFSDNEMLFNHSHEVDALTSPSIPKIIRPSENVSKWDIQNTAEVMDWTNYHRLDVIHNFMDKLESDYPSICSTFVIGKSLEGRDLKMLKISNSNTRNKPVWMDAGIHAREWIAPATATYIANNIASNFESLPEYMTNKDWYFLPVFNPDGYEYSHTKDRMWRKSRAMHLRECVGVDLNRNFSHGWGLKGSSDNPKSNFFRGPRPFSEPESCAVRDAIINSGVSFNVYITLHSYGQIILFPFAYQAELCPNYIRLLEGASVMSKGINETYGSIYKVGISKDVMYGAAGTSNDWCHGVAGIPYCYLIELRSKQHKFIVPKEEIVESGEEVLNGIKALMEFVDSYEHMPPPMLYETENTKANGDQYMERRLEHNGDNGGRF